MITRKDVADRAGVSVSAVSRTMNNNGYVAMEKQEKIWKAVQELGYRSNPFVSAIKKSQTHQIMFYAKDLKNPFNIELYDGMVEYSKKRGYIVLLNASLDADEIKTILVDGIILPNSEVARVLQENMDNQLHIPIVSASHGLPIIDTHNIPYIDSDTYRAVEILIKYLRAKGHKKIAFAMPRTTKQSLLLQPRFIAFFNLMYPLYEKKIFDYVFVQYLEEDFLTFKAENLFEEGKARALDFANRNCDATAIIAFNDECAFGMMKQFQELNIKVPQDISIVGIDGVEARKYANILLTTVNLHIKEQGVVCAKTLIDLIEKKKVRQFTSIPVSLIEGQSVKKIGPGIGNKRHGAN